MHCISRFVLQDDRRLGGVGWYTAIAANSIHITLLPWRKPPLPVVFTPNGMVFTCPLLSLLVLHGMVFRPGTFSMGCRALWRSGCLAVGMGNTDSTSLITLPSADM